MSKLELLLEAERRGILPPDKRALLQEARRRGLVPGGEEEEPVAPIPAAEPERTIGGYAKEAFKGLIPGAAGMVETAITGAAALLPEEAEQAVRRRVSGVVEPIREAFAPAPGYEDTAARKLGEAVGSTVPFLPLGALGAAGRAAAVGLGIGAGAGEARQRAEQEGATEEERGLATALGTAPGALEAYAPIRILRRLGFGDEAVKEVAGFVPALRRAAQAGGEEGLMEASSQVLQNLIAKGVYAPDEAVFGGVGEAAALGGGAGAIVSAIADLALGRRLRGRGAEEPPAAPTEEEIKALPAPRTAGYKVDSQGNVVPMTEAEAEEGARLNSQFRALGLGEAEAIANRMQEQRGKQFLLGADEALQRYEREQDAAAAAKDDMQYLRSLPMTQMGLPLEGGEAGTEGMLPPATEPRPQMFVSGEEALAKAIEQRQLETGEEVRPRSRAYREEAKDLGVRLNRRGEVKPNQAVFEQPETEVAPEQTGFNLPGIPMERLVPRDRVLRAMAITEDKKNIPNLQFATQLRPMELQKTLGDLKKEGAIAFNKKANEWELTPAGVENVRTGSETKPPRSRRSPSVSVPPQGAAGPDLTATGDGGMGGVGAPTERIDAGEAANVPALGETAPPATAPAATTPPVDRMDLIRRAAEQRTAEMRTRAIDAFDADEINEKTYLAVTEELKKPVPNFARVTSMMEGTAKPKRERNVGIDYRKVTFQRAPSVRNPQIDTPEFKRFFNESKVVDANGQPLVVYHGTGADIENFKASNLGGALGTGIYFTPSPEFAGEYATREGGNVVPVYLAVKNPLVIDGSVSKDPMIEALVRLGMDINKASSTVEKAYEKKGYITTEVRRKAQDKGFDGIIQSYNGNIGEIVAFSPNQVKSAVGNVGTFDPDSASISKQEAPSPHPEWATQHERDVAGEVVYSDPDTALVRGYSVFTGQPVFAGIDRKTGNRTSVDIGSFTGTLFSPEQKQKLVEAKKRIVAQDSARLAQNPDGPFTGATSNVVTSENVNPNYGKFLSNLMGSMGLGDVRVFLLHPEDVRNRQDKYKLYGHYASAMSAGTDPGEEGSIRQYGETLKDFYISFKPGMTEARALETIGHELGHLVERVAYNKASPEVKNAIRAEYDRWLKDTKGKQGADLVRALRNRETAEAHASGITADTRLNDSYWRSFSEWFADNTSKWVTTSEKPVGIVEKFFADVARKLRELVAAITGNRFAPAKTVKKFLDDMGPGSADAWLTEPLPHPLSIHQNSPSQKPIDPFDAAARYSMSPAEQQKNDRAFLSSIASIPSKLPKPTSGTFQAAADAASNATPAMRRALYSTLTAHDFDRMYGKHTKGFGQLWNELNSEGAFLRKQEDLIMENYQKWEKILSKYSPAERDRIFDTFMATTTTKIKRTTKDGKVVEKFGVEVLDLKDDARRINWVADKAHPLYQQYQSLVRKDPKLEEVYKGIRLAYLDYSLGIENVLKQYLAPTEWQKLISQFNEKRLPVYFPLFRKGDFKLKYVDANGDTVSLQFETLGQRNRAEAEARRNGATDIIPSRVGTKEAEAIPPSGFFGKIVGTLTEQKVDPEVITSIVNTYLDLIPAQSTLQFARQRKGAEGYSKDMLDAYANVGSSYARRLTNLTYTPKFRAAQEKIKEDLENARSDGALDTNVADDLLDATEKQMAFIRDPKLNSVAAKLSYFSFQMYLGANVSTAIINLVDIPTITYSRLAGKHGWGKAFNAIQKAATTYFSKNKSKEMQELLQRGLDSGVLREQQLRDIAEFKNMGSKYERIKAGAERVSSWAFAKSDMFNRNVAFMAAYQLSKNTPEGAFDQNAFDAAQRAVYDVYGSSFPKASPPIMGNGFARTALTFKKFALIRINLLLNAYREATKGESPEVRKAARREILAYFGTAYLFAGVQGMPVVGALSVLASVLNGALGDDDEPYNPDFELRDAIGLFNYKGPANYLLGVDFASRTGWTGMLWREDPKRMAEVGPVTYTMEQLLGPAYSYANGWFKPNGVIDSFSAGEYQRGFEQLSPKVVGNILKGMRYAEEGAVTASGKPLVDDVDAYNVFMQIFGFRPSDVAEAGDIAGATTRMQREILERRNSIIARAAVARLSGDYEGFQSAVEEAQAFSATFPERAITAETLIGAVQRRQKSIAQSVYGITVDQKLSRRIYDELGLEE